MINDINSDIIILYRVLERFYPYFADMLKYKICARAEFDRLLKQTPDTLLDFERAARFLYLQKTTFGGKVTGQNFGVGMGRPARFDISKLLPFADDLHERLCGVITECLPYEKLIDKYGRDYTLFYLDPPYWNSEKSYGKDIFGKDNFTNLSAILKNIKGKFVMSINDVQEIRKIFKGFYMKEVQTKYTVSVSAAKTASELLISNVDLNSL